MPERLPQWRRRHPMIKDRGGRPSAARRGYDRRWQKLRKAYLAAHPICEDPFGIHAAANETAVIATDVDHIIPKRAGGLDAWENLQALCHNCHSRKTRKGE